MITFQTSLFPHQKDHVKFHLKHPQSANWSEQGTGKSVIALKYLITLINAGIIERALIVCPLSVSHTWELEVAKHTNAKIVSLEGSLDNKLALLNKPSNLYSISYDSIPGRRSFSKGYDTFGILLTALLKKEFNVIVADEVPLIKTYGALRTKALTFLCDTIPYHLFLSGTPITNKAFEIFNIYRALDGGKIFGKNFFSARRKYFSNVGFAFPKWELKEEMKDDIIQKMYQIAVRVRKEDCLDLPPKIFSPRFGYLSKEQEQFYIPIVEELLRIIQTEQGTIRIQNSMVKIQKLAQITSGFLYTDKEPYIFEGNPKLELCMEELDKIPNEQVIIYCYWVEDIKIISKKLNERGESYTTMYGKTPQSERAKIIDSFNNKKVHILVSNIGVGGYGLTLVTSSTIIYYDFSFKSQDFTQSQDRIHRIGQTKTCWYMPLMMRKTVDEYIYNNLQNKIQLAQSIVDGQELTNNLKEFLEDK